MAAWDMSGIAAGLERANQAIREGAADGLEKLAADALRQMQAVTPVLSGDLRGSGRYQVDRAALKAAVGFGSGASAEYVVIEHESMSNHHPDGQPKFAEIPLMQQVAPAAAPLLAASVKARLG